MTTEERQAKADTASFEYYRNGACCAEACRRAGISPATFDKWLALGLIKNPDPSGEILRVNTRSGSTRGRYM